MRGLEENVVHLTKNDGAFQILGIGFVGRGLTCRDDISDAENGTVAIYFVSSCIVDVLIKGARAHSSNSPSTSYPGFAAL
jgi:hypothetical protein